jgi:hypothetical protein
MESGGKNSTDNPNTIGGIVTSLMFWAVYLQ